MEKNLVHKNNQFTHMKTQIAYKHIIACTAVALSFAMAPRMAKAASTYIDFGSIESTTGSSPTYNNIGFVTPLNNAALNTSTFVTANLTQNGTGSLASVALVDSANGASGISLSIGGKYSGNGSPTLLGNAGGGNNYTGTVPSDASFFPSSATRDQIFVNNGGIMRITLSWLSGSYDLTLFTGSANLSSAAWTLATGTATTSRFQLLDNSYVANTGQFFSSATTAARAVEWLNITPVAGVIAFDITASTSGGGSLNAMQFTAIPEPSTLVLGLIGGCALLVMRRCRQA